MTGASPRSRQNPRKAARFVDRAKWHAAVRQRLSRCRVVLHRRRMPTPKSERPALHLAMDRGWIWPPAVGVQSAGLMIRLVVRADRSGSEAELFGARWPLPRSA